MYNLTKRFLEQSGHWWGAAFNQIPQALSQMGQCVSVMGGGIQARRDLVMSILNKCAQANMKEGGRQAFDLETKKPNLGWGTGRERKETK